MWCEEREGAPLSTHFDFSLFVDNIFGHEWNAGFLSFSSERIAVLFFLSPSFLSPPTPRHGSADCHRGQALQPLVRDAAPSLGRDLLNHRSIKCGRFLYIILIHSRPLGPSTMCQFPTCPSRTISLSNRSQNTTHSCPTLLAVTPPSVSGRPSAPSSSVSPTRS